MPLAVKRFVASQLPIEVTLSDADAMMPALKLSSFAEVILGARVSKSGNPIAQAGDLFVESAVIDASNTGSVYQLEINQVR